MADLLLLVPLENSFLNPVKECYDEPSKPIVQFDPVDVVPLDLWRIIFANTVEDLYNLALVCKTWYELICSPTFLKEVQPALEETLKVLFVGRTTHQDLIKSRNAWALRKLWSVHLRWITIACGGDQNAFSKLVKFFHKISDPLEEETANEGLSADFAVHTIYSSIKYNIHFNICLYSNPRLYYDYHCLTEEEKNDKNTQVSAQAFLSFDEKAKHGTYVENEVPLYLKRDDLRRYFEKPEEDLPEVITEDHVQVYELSTCHQSIRRLTDNIIENRVSKVNFNTKAVKSEMQKSSNMAKFHIFKSVVGGVLFSPIWVLLGFISLICATVLKVQSFQNIRNIRHVELSCSVIIIMFFLIIMPIPICVYNLYEFGVRSGVSLMLDRAWKELRDEQVPLLEFAFHIAFPLQ